MNDAEIEPTFEKAPQPTVTMPRDEFDRLQREHRAAQAAIDALAEAEEREKALEAKLREPCTLCGKQKLDTP